MPPLGAPRSSAARSPHKQYSNPQVEPYVSLIPRPEGTISSLWTAHEVPDGCPVRGRAMLKLYAGAVDTTCEQAARPDPTVPRCRAQSPQVAFSPEQVAIPRARKERGRLQPPEGGPGRARMKKRVFTLLLVAGLLAVAALTALTFPALAQTQTVYVRLASGEVVPVTVDVPPGRDARRHPAARPRSSRPSAPAPTVPTTPTSPSAPKPPPTTAPAPAPGGGGEPELRRRIASRSARAPAGASRTSRAGAATSQGT